MRRTRSSILLAAASLVLATSASRALAQTWTGPRTTPSLRELVTVDRTGEEDWPFGAEDVAGDGLDVFEPAEQAVDLRSAYAATDQARFWLRAYVSSSSEPGESLRLFAFVDSDDDDATGGSAVADEIDAALTSDPTTGGYDYVIGMSAITTAVDVWAFDAQQDVYDVVQTSSARAQGEMGVDTDPLRFRADRRGYLQASVELADIELTTSCNGNLFLRAISVEGDDLDVGLRVGCVPSDADANGVPDVVQQVQDCNEDADCPAGAVCIAGECRYTPACIDDGDCAAGESCVDGLCVADGGQSCDTSADCDGLICSNGSCEPCTAAGQSCAAGQTCAADGRCVDGTAAGGGEGGAAALVDPDEEVQGGACTCRLGRSRSSFAWAFVLGLAALALGRRRAA